MSYFLTDEKVYKESPGTFRMVPGLSRRPKGVADWLAIVRHYFRFPFRNPFGYLFGGRLFFNTQKPSAFGQRVFSYRKIYLSTNSTARIYISGVIFLALPVQRFSTT